MFASRVKISCLCGKTSQEVAVRGSHDEQQLRSSWRASQTVCHCHACRHVTGLLCTSFLPIERPPQSSLDGLQAYDIAEPQTTSYFCTTCGCHVFASSSQTASHGEAGNEDTENWMLATGVIAESPDPEDGTPVRNSAELTQAWTWEHSHVSDTKDGGISVWINSTSSPSARAQASQAASHVSSVKQPSSHGAAEQQATLPASCHCGTVRFHITRPDASSSLASSPFPDLMLPYCRTDRDVVANPSDAKWWLRGEDGTKYLAGTCACRSCRLASGFEIQTWAFVPRANIFIYPLPGADGAERPTARPLDFQDIPQGVLRAYESSPGVAREFCPRCGATVFWHNTGRPDLIDVSVGLLEAPEGARAESWLEWWTGRVSFAEDAAPRTPGRQIASLRAHSLIQSLQNGLSLWNKG